MPYRSLAEAGVAVGRTRSAILKGDQARCDIGNPRSRNWRLADRARRTASRVSRRVACAIALPCPREHSEKQPILRRARSEDTRAARPVERQGRGDRRSSPPARHSDGATRRRIAAGAGLDGSAGETGNVRRAAGPGAAEMVALAVRSDGRSISLTGAVSDGARPHRVTGGHSPVPRCLCRTTALARASLVADPAIKKAARRCPATGGE